MRDTPILTQRRKNCILVKTNLEKSFILGLLFVFPLTVSLRYLTNMHLCTKIGKKYILKNIGNYKRKNIENTDSGDSR